MQSGHTIGGGTTEAANPPSALDREVLARVAENGPRSLSALWASERVAAGDLADSIARLHGMERVPAEALRSARTVLGDLSLVYLQEHWLLPYRGPDGPALAVGDPSDLDAIRAVELALGGPVTTRIASFDDLQAVFRDLAEPRPDAPAPAPAAPDERSFDEDLARLQDLASGAPVVQAVDEMLETALRLDATDIHVEPQRTELRIRLRVDGRLRIHRNLPAAMSRGVISRIKILAGLDIGERRLPQDGRSRVAIGADAGPGAKAAEVDLRVATMPTLHGESAVVRVLAGQGKALDLARLGMGERDLATMRQQLAEPHGLIIVAGPTGSGKTTTLSAALSILNQAESKIMTIEDPIEYQIAGVNQTQIKPSIDLSFASALRSLLRHDPDILMVGEMRDRETAAIGVQAALTGHLVLTTLHTNNAVEAVVRLLDLGVDGFLLRSALRCVVGQRLVRRLCPHCRRPEAEPSPALAALVAAGATAPRPEDTIFAAVGCGLCAGTGFRGRVGIFEVMRLDAETRRQIRSYDDATEITDLMRRKGMTTMLDDGLAKVRSGLTTAEEVLRATL